MLTPLLIAVILVALVTEFLNGSDDTGTALGAVVSSQALPVRTALAMASVFSFLGAMLNEGVALTMSKGLVSVVPGLEVLLAALLAAATWNFAMLMFEIPSSSSQALVGALVGSVIYFLGADVVLWQGVIEKVVIPIFAGPVVGFLIAGGILKLILRIFAKSPYAKTNALLQKLQVLASVFMAYEYGSNDAQKAVGIITMALVSGGIVDADAAIPLWVKLLCAVTIVLATCIGGTKIMKTIGTGITKMTPEKGLASQLSSIIVIQGLTMFGAPVSTSQVVASATAGAATSKSIFSVRWSMVADIVKSWFVTVPISAAMGFAFAWATAQIMMLF